MLVRKLTARGRPAKAGRPFCVFGTTRDHKPAKTPSGQFFNSEPPAQALLLGPREGMAAQFPAERVADLGHDFDLRWMIKLRIFELMNSVLVVNRVGRKMDQVGRVITEQSGAH